MSRSYRLFNSCRTFKGQMKKWDLSTGDLAADPVIQGFPLSALVFKFYLCIRINIFNNFECFFFLHLTPFPVPLLTQGTKKSKTNSSTEN